MALKPDRLRNPYADDMTFFMDEAAEPGGFAVISTGGSGAATDQSNAVVTYTTAPSGKVIAGVVLQKMVDKDLSQYSLNRYNCEVQKGGKILLNRQGVFNTNMIYPGVTPTVGATAYLGPSGLLLVTTTSAQHPTACKFLSTKDADGYAKVSVNL